MQSVDTLSSPNVNLKLRLDIYNNLWELSILTEARVKAYNTKKGYLYIEDVKEEPKHKRMWELLIELTYLWEAAKCSLLQNIDV